MAEAAGAWTAPTLRAAPAGEDALSDGAVLAWAWQSLTAMSSIAQATLNPNMDGLERTGNPR